MTAQANIRFKGDALIVDIIGHGSQRAVYSTSMLRPFTAPAEVPWRTELLECMLAVYTVDRVIRRPKHSWRRSLELTLPVSSVERWQAAREGVEELIASSTGDDVKLRLTTRAPSDIHCDARAESFALETPAAVSVGLLSDGLDSLCGAVRALSRERGRYAFVSVLTNSRREARIRKIRRGLRNQFGERVSYCSLDVHLNDGPKKQERTQRSRTMLAITAGLTAAAGYGAPTLDIYENGIGILNLPVPNLQMPHEASQVLHPRNVGLWKTATRHLLPAINLAFPNRWLTKSQVCEQLPPSMRSLIVETSSCDAPPRRDQYPDCGTCGSCTMRRIALARAAIADYDIQYAAPARRLPEFLATDVFSYHAGLLAEALNSADPWAALVQLQPTLATSLQAIPVEHERAQACAATIALLQRHVDDVSILGAEHAA